SASGSRVDGSRASPAPSLGSHESRYDVHRQDACIPCSAAAHSTSAQLVERVRTAQGLRPGLLAGRRVVGCARTCTARSALYADPCHFDLALPGAAHLSHGFFETYSTPYLSTLGNRPCRHPGAAHRK